MAGVAQKNSTTSTLARRLDSDHDYTTTRPTYSRSRPTSCRPGRVQEHRREAGGAVFEKRFVPSPLVCGPLVFCVRLSVCMCVGGWVRIRRGEGLHWSARCVAGSRSSPPGAWPSDAARRPAQFLSKEDPVPNPDFFPRINKKRTPNQPVPLPRLLVVVGAPAGLGHVDRGLRGREDGLVPGPPLRCVATDVRSGELGETALDFGDGELDERGRDVDVGVRDRVPGRLSFLHSSSAAFARANPSGRFRFRSSTASTSASSTVSSRRPRACLPRQKSA